MAQTSDINLAQYFRGVDGDYRCPECPDRKDLGSTVELLKHVWLHRASEPDARIEFPYKGGPVMCPFLGCENWDYKYLFSLTQHFHEHTGEKRHICPHVIGCDQESKKLCGYATHTEWILLQHRRHEHGFIGAANVTKHPWVKNANISLSAAKLCLGNPQSAPLDHGATAVYDNHPRVYHVQEPPIPAPSNALGLIHEPTPSNSDSATRLPIQETPTPLRSRLDSAPFYRHIPCYRMHPYKQPDNSTADHRTEGRTKVINNFRYHRLVSSGEFGFHPVLKEWFELPKWENDGALDQVQLERIIPPPRATATNPSTDDWPYIP